MQIIVKKDFIKTKEFIIKKGIKEFIKKKKLILNLNKDLEVKNVMYLQKKLTKLFRVLTRIKEYNRQTRKICIWNK